MFVAQISIILPHSKQFRANAAPRQNPLKPTMCPSRFTVLKKWLSIAAGLLCLLLLGRKVAAQTPDPWQDHTVFRINKIDPHATLFPFENRELALSGEPDPEAQPERVAGTGPGDVQLEFGLGRNRLVLLPAEPDLLRGHLPLNPGCVPVTKAEGIKIQLFDQHLLPAWQTTTMA